MGHYTEDTYRRIGELFGLKLIAIHQEARAAVEISVTPATEKTLGYKIFRKLLAVSSRLLFRVAKEPGHSMVAIFERHA